MPLNVHFTYRQPLVPGCGVAYIEQMVEVEIGIYSRKTYWLSTQCKFFSPKASFIKFDTQHKCSQICKHDISISLKV